MKTEKERTPTRMIAEHESFSNEAPGNTGEWRDYRIWNALALLVH
mgnify:CR=1 FL=1